MGRLRDVHRSVATQDTLQHHHDHHDHHHHHHHKPTTTTTTTPTTTTTTTITKTTTPSLTVPPTGSGGRFDATTAAAVAVGSEFPAQVVVGKAPATKFSIRRAEAELLIVVRRKLARKPLMQPPDHHAVLFVSAAMSGAVRLLRGVQGAPPTPKLRANND